MKQINKDGSNYAPNLEVGLEFFFTRFDAAHSGALPTIYTATRTKVSKPFGKPRKIEAITGFAPKRPRYHRTRNHSTTTRM